MRLGTFTNFTKREDIRIEISSHALLFRMTLAGNPFNNSYGPQIRMNHISAAGGTVPILQKMPLLALLELDALVQGEGYFVCNAILPDGSTMPVFDADPEEVLWPNGTTFYVEGLMVISEEGAFELVDGAYLALELTANVAVTSLSINSIDHTAVVKSYRRLNPTPINGFTKEIDVRSASGILLNPRLVDNLQLRGQRSVRYEGEELPAIARSSNDLVAVDNRRGTVYAGFLQRMYMRLRDVTSLTIEPTGSTQFVVYLVEQAVAA